VRNNQAFENVAGIGENSLNADVYGNDAFNCAGGILVFDLPDLQLKKGIAVCLTTRQGNNQLFCT
jgi:hypothetical protein